MRSSSSAPRSRLEEMRTRDYLHPGTPRLTAPRPAFRLAGRSGRADRAGGAEPPRVPGDFRRLRACSRRIYSTVRRLERTGETGCRITPRGRSANVAVVGHGGSGKTTLVESLLAAAGAVAAAGSVEKGTATCDYEPEVTGAPAVAVERGRESRPRFGPRQLRRHARVSGLPRPGAARPRRGGDRRGGRGRAVRHPDHHPPDDGGGGLARPRAPRRREQDRCAGPGPRGAPREPSGDLRPGVPSLGLPAPGREGGGGLLLRPRPVRRHRILLGRGGAEPGGGPGGGNGRGADGDLLRSGRSPPPDELRGAFRTRAPARGTLVPVCFVSAASGAGVGLLLDVLARLMPSPPTRTRRRSPVPTAPPWRSSPIPRQGWWRRSSA